MKRLTFSIITIMLCATAVAQKKAVTETGEEVFLYEDGKWAYINPVEEKQVEIPLNTSKFEKGAPLTFQLKSTNVNHGFWLDPKKWSFEKTESGQPEYQLKLKTGDLYGMILTEKTEIPLESFKNIALVNAKKAAPDAVVKKQEYRIVNGLKVLHLQIDGTIQGIKFTYYGYYYSNSSGTTQFVAYTSQGLLNEFLPEIEQLLNGISEIKS